MIELNKLNLEQTYNAPYTTHPGSTKMYQDLKETLWWNGLNRGVADLSEDV